LIFFRSLQGVGVAILYTVPIAILPSLFSENQRGKATGILIGVNSLGLAIGPIVGGLIVSALSWRWIFFINLPIIKNHS
jgi:MFS family permease